MNRRNKAFFIMMAVCLMALSFAMPAAAAEISKDKYTYSISKKFGEVSESLTIDDLGDIYEDVQVTSTLVPEKAILSYTAKVNTSVIVLGYSLENGILVADPVPWTINGNKEFVNALSANTTATVTFDYGVPYYELFIWDEATGDQTSYFFKIDKGAASGDQPDTWAKAEVDAAIAADLVPTELQGSYKQKITRADFAKIIIRLLEVKTGQTIDEILVGNEVSLSDNPFTDTNIKEVIAANLMGIVNGKGNGIFDPSGSITRQEAAVMLANTAEVLGYDVVADASAFTDNKTIASWAKPSVDFVFTYGVMNGTGNNTFSPKGTYTRQQAYMTIVRLSEVLVE
ncbi:S-layer homology domain-containing protein [Paenibacillus sp. LHD-38]|uniref:S-layer homology domain-containing protein n=1 Tax=Paenibacillus sp. LHD-38 TaxID=3072143 RepID=UPI00280F0CEB|nr:S-layer homology domain-containing protein [Paenibacillus sp. LHD-38]MDQ8737617.1 S-layer homology domain-containing protein [Paenibacillus sp. LHD-38]